MLIEYLVKVGELHVLKRIRDVVWAAPANAPACIHWAAVIRRATRRALDNRCAPETDRSLPSTQGLPEVRRGLLVAQRVGLLDERDVSVLREWIAGSARWAWLDFYAMAIWIALECRAEQTKGTAA